MAGSARLARSPSRTGGGEGGTREGYTGGYSGYICLVQRDIEGPEGPFGPFCLPYCLLRPACSLRVRTQTPLADQRSEPLVAWTGSERSSESLWRPYCSKPLKNRKMTAFWHGFWSQSMPKHKGFGPERVSERGPKGSKKGPKGSFLVISGPEARFRAVAPMVLRKWPGLNPGIPGT